MAIFAFGGSVHVGDGLAGCRRLLTVVARVASRNRRLGMIKIRRLECGGRMATVAIVGRREMSCDLAFGIWRAGVAGDAVANETGVIGLGGGRPIGLRRVVA